MIDDVLTLDTLMDRLCDLREQVPGDTPIALALDSEGNAASWACSIDRSVMAGPRGIVADDDAEPGDRIALVLWPTC